MTDTPDKLRALSVHIVEEEGDAPNFAANARALINEAADEIERLQSDVTELMSACSEALNAKRSAALDELGALDGEMLP